MIECLFTIDYEVYGNGEGSLQELVYEPAQKLKTLFYEAGAKFVVFVEAAEFEKIEAAGTDPASASVRRQVREFHEQGFEIALHLHPQWCNAEYQNGKWVLDYREYNLCPLERERITEIVRGAIGYLQNVLEVRDFAPLSFRAGNWLFQPTKIAAEVLAAQGVKIDSSVFKGGQQHKHKLDYRRAVHNGYYWTFRDDVATADPDGAMLEIPIYTKTVPFWKMVTAKRMGLQQKSASSARKSRQRLYRILDLLRFRHPLKFDFCRMTLNELISIVETAIRADQQTPDLFKPIVAIGHTKDLVDFNTIKSFLAYLKSKDIKVSTFEDVFPKCRSQARTRTSRADLQFPVAAKLP